MDVDRQTDEMIEMVSQGARLTTNLMTYVFSSLADRLEKNGDKELIDKKTKEGKQKISDLLNKHKDGVHSLDENLTKEQVKDYQKEFKKLGVDFSVVKNEKDNYSFFFAGGQAEVIEKALKNVVELKSRVQENDKVKEARIDMDSQSKDMTEPEIEKANKAYSDYVERTEAEKKKEIIPETKDLNDKELQLFNKIKNYHETEKQVTEEVKQEIELEPPTEKQLKLAEKLGVENFEDMNKVEISLALEKAGAEPSYFNTKEHSKDSKVNSKEILDNKLSELSPKELELFEKKMEYENTATSPVFDKREAYRLADELQELKKGHSKESIEKINNLDKDIKNYDNSSEVSRGDKLNANEILRETKKHSAKRSKENTKHVEKEQPYSIKNVKKIDKEIKKESKNKDRDRHKEHAL